MAELDDAEPDIFVSNARSFSDDTLDRIIKNAQLQGSASELETAALVEVARRRIEDEPVGNHKSPPPQKSVPAG